MRMDTTQGLCCEKVVSILQLNKFIYVDTHLFLTNQRATYIVHVGLLFTDINFNVHLY